VAAVIQVEALERTYRLGEIQVFALRGVSFQIQAGELLAVMGPSGSGKSTLMNILGALDQADSGQYLLDGEEVGQLRDDQLANIRNRKIGFVFQTFNLLPRTTALANCEMPLIYSGVSARERHERAVAALESVGLAERIRHHPNELSGGQQQRVAIARALLNSRQGITILLVTHDPFIARHTRRVLRLSDGKVVGDDRIAHPLLAGESERPSELSLGDEARQATVGSTP
jgi:putative ABC transport system ATP-binding protein